jgi:hypothetical protein
MMEPIVQSDPQADRIRVVMDNLNTHKGTGAIIFGCLQTIHPRRPP